MWKLIIVILFTFVFVGVVAAQTGTKAVKFAEFGDITASDLKQKMSDFRGALLRDHSNHGYIVTNGTPAQISARRKLILRSMPVIYDDPTRITFVDGRGRRVRTVLWIVPPGATPPTP